MKISEERVWMKHFPKEAAEAELPRCTAYRYVKDNNANRLDEVAIHYYGADITHRQLQERIDNAANALVAVGVRPGDVVSFLSVAIPETIYTIYAVNKIGAIANTIDPRMDIDTIRRTVQESGSRVLFVIDIAFPKVARIMDDIKQDYIITQSAAHSLPPLKKLGLTLMSRTKIPYSDKVIKGKTFLEKGRHTKAQEAPYVPDSVFAITYTGGTTGFPKGVMITNDSINAAAFNFLHAGLVHELGDRFLDIIPVFTSYGMCCGMHMPLAISLTLVPIPKFEASKFGLLVKTFRPNHMISTPAFYETMMASKEVQGLDLSFMTTLGSGGDTMNAGLEKKLGDFMRTHNIKYPLAQGYGMSELSAAVSFCVNDIYKPGSVGIPSVSTTVSIFDEETGEELGYNQLGEICITGASMMKGYYNRPEETANVMRLHEDGKVWVHSGDLGYMDEDGFLFIIGRIKRMICRFDGHKIYPVNMEGLIATHEEVLNCCSIGISDMDRSQGQQPLVLVEIADCVQDKDAFCRMLFKECDEKLEERGKPVAIIPVDTIPLTGSGKNDFRTLEAQYANFDYHAWAAAGSN